MTMAAARLWRLFLAAAVVVAMQSSLLHPLEHFHGASGARTAAAAVQSLDDGQPFESSHSKLCELCVAGAALGAAAFASSAAEAVLASARLAASGDESLFLAAFTPLFRSQAPPPLL